MAWPRSTFLSLLSLSCLAAPVSAGDAPFDWRGFYLGFHLGGALDLAEIDNPFGPSIFGDTVRKSGPLAGGQAGYNWQHGATLLGVETDVSWADLGGTNTCFAYSGFYISANCRADVDALGTFTGRLGWALSSDGRTLIFGKAGLAWAHTEIEATPNGDIGFESFKESGVDWGWTVGGGIERAVTSRWTVKAEYGFLSLDNGFGAPRSLFQSAPPAPPDTPVAGAPTDRHRDIHQFKVGMNYMLGAARGPDVALATSGASLPKGYTLTAGARYVYGWGQFHKDLGIQREGLGSLASRLTYDNNDVSGGEAFARLDTPFGLMVKGLIGGATSDGSLNDEDWDIDFPDADVAYSNTLSGVENDIGYGIVDVGYAVWRGAQHSVAPFVGYSEFRQDMTGLGCRQIADRFSDCEVPIPRNDRGITEDDTWRALRIGIAADTAIAPRLSLAGEAAYLPYVAFEGTDDHLLRNLVSPEDGNGIGVQLEAMLSYAVTDALSLGIGGRYWSLWTTSGTVNFGGTGTIIPMRYAAEQGQLLVQGSYRFGFGARD
jgi:opacity protein-like surface antigen